MPPPRLTPLQQLDSLESSGWPSQHHYPRWERFLRDELSELISISMTVRIGEVEKTGKQEGLTFQLHVQLAELGQHFVRVRVRLIQLGLQGIAPRFGGSFLLLENSDFLFSMCLLGGSCFGHLGLVFYQLGLLPRHLGKLRFQPSHLVLLGLKFILKLGLAVSKLLRQLGQGNTVLVLFGKEFMITYTTVQLAGRLAHGHKAILKRRNLLSRAEILDCAESASVVQSWCFSVRILCSPEASQRG